MKRSVLVFLLAVCAASCGSDRPPITGPPPVVTPPPPGGPPPDPPDPPTLAVERIMAFGDSLTHGPDQPALAFSIHDHGTPGGSISYPFKLHAMLVNTYTGQTEAIKVFNSGSGGEAVTSSTAKMRMLEELPRHKPEVLLLMHGANDLFRPVTISRIVFHMEELIELAREGGVKHVFLASLPPQVQTLASEKVPEYNKELRKLQSTVVTFVDVFANINTQTMMQDDGLHLNETGNQKIADLFYAAIKAAFHREPQ